MIANRILIPSLLIGWVIVIFSGCVGGGDELPQAEASGKVTMNGKPVSALVNFISKERGATYSATTNAAGEFKFDTTIDVGNYVVVVTPPPITEAPDSSEDMKKASEHRKQASIPEAYTNEARSGLTAEVKAEGENNFTFDLKAGGPGSGSSGMTPP